MKIRDIRRHKYAEWRQTVLLKANNKCAICGEKATHAHHKRHWVSHPALRYNINNGMALCQYHHGIIHFTDFNRYDPLKKNPFVVVIPGIAYYVDPNFNTAEILRDLNFFGFLWLS